ncbi:MAG: dienelactone hydrolase family protein, partial [Proteobacteria bacterium]|nr:dienelactone hydrolase family protein [Pseudomonadota bacterium]
MTGKYIDIKAADGSGQFRGYLATPEVGSGPGILLLQEIFGINWHIRDVADYYAEEGYTVLAPDLFWRMEPNVELGYSEEEFQKAFGFYQQFDIAKAIE